jgi:hypothetical protein
VVICDHADGMPVLLAVAVALVLGLAVRYSAPGQARRDALVVGSVALGLRVLVAGGISLVFRDNYPSGIWLNDEVSFWRATQALLPNPWESAVPQGLDHLSGNAYLGLTTGIALFAGLDAMPFRLASVALGAIMALLSFWVARRFFGRRAGLAAGIGTAAWPTLVLWSSVMLRDIVCGLVVMIVWWTLSTDPARQRVRTACVLILALVLLTNLRPYLAAAVALGVVCWYAAPGVSRIGWRRVALCAAPGVAIAVVLSAQQLTRVDQIAHELLYRQTVTRMETLGQLYRDPPPNPLPPIRPFFPGTAVALPDPNSSWVLTGLVDETLGPDTVSVVFTDETERTLRTDQLVLLESADFTPLQLLAWVPINLVSLVTGFDPLNDRGTPLWVLDALAWDVVLVAAVLAARRAGLASRNVLFPACVVVGTVLALIAIPGAPGNADRHRASHTLPLLLVLASGLLWTSRLGSAALLSPLNNASSKPASATTPASSSSRSA